MTSAVKKICINEKGICGSGQNIINKTIFDFLRNMIIVCENRCGVKVERSTLSTFERMSAEADEGLYIHEYTRRSGTVGKRIPEPICKAEHGIQGAEQA
jgi:hypothetical protein